MEKAEPADWLAAIVDSSEDAIIVLDRDRVIRYANSAAFKFGIKSGAREVVGERYDEILGKNLILDENGAVADATTFPSVLALTKGETVTNRIYQQVIDNVYIWVAVSSIPIRNESGEVNYAIVRISDISSQRSKEDKLNFLIKTIQVLSLTEDTEERLTQKARLTVPLLADWCTVNIVKEDGSISRAAIVHRDPEKMKLVSELAERSEHELGVVRRVVETKQGELYPVITDESLSKSSISSERLALARKLGVTSSIILPIISNGNVLGILSLAYSDSGRHYTEEDFTFMQEYCNHISLFLENAKLYEEIRSKDQSKDEFLATLSHELRNPLAPIKTMLELMKLKPQSAELRHDIGVIEHQFDHLTKILIDLLEVNRYARGKIHLELRRVNLLSAVKNSIESATPFIKKKGIVFDAKLPSQAIVIRADQTRLEQALMNVLHNAEKFTPPGGRISVELTSNEQTATITIRDTGAGIESEMLSHIFEPGARNKDGAHRTEGLGLGLVLVKEIVQLHGGTIVAESEGLGKGSAFTITLPILQRPLIS